MDNAHESAKKKAQPCHQCLHAPTCLLSPFSPKQWAILSKFHFPTKQIAQKQTLYRQGDATQNLYIIRAGLLKSITLNEAGQSHVLGFHLPPDCIGWEQTHSATAQHTMIAVEQTQVCVISTISLSQLTQHYPELTLLLMQMRNRYQSYNNAGILRKSAYQRVALFLLNLSERYYALGYTASRYPIRMTHQDIANYLSLAPGTLSKHLHQLERAKIILLGKHQMTILDKAGLNAVAISTECII